MLYSTVILALAASASMVFAAPDGCKEDFSGQFTFTVQNVTSAPASKEKRQTSSMALCPSAPVIRLSGGIITDQEDRVGEIVANEQLQFDPGPQAGYKTASGFSVCENNTLALESTIFYQCLSGNFYNLYDKSLGKQCNEVYIIIEPCQLQSGQSLASAPPASATGSASVSTMPIMSMMPAPTSSSAVSAPASASATPSSTVTSAAVASTGTGSPASGANGTVSTASSPSGSTAPEAFKGAASTLAIGQLLAVVAAGFVGFALL